LFPLKTALSVISEKIVETGILLSVAITPVFFNPYSNRLFEADKSAVVRSFGLVILLAWIIKIMEGDREGNLFKGFSGISGFLGTPIIIPVLLVFISSLLGTVFSVLPWVSVWGSYERAQGIPKKRAD
jgi:hypothetical protein